MFSITVLRDNSYSVYFITVDTREEAIEECHKIGITNTDNLIEISNKFEWNDISKII